MQKLKNITNKSRRIFLVFFILITSIWTWRLLLGNALIFFYVILAILLLNLAEKRRIYFILGMLCIFILISFQWWTSKHESLTKLSNDQIRMRDERLKEYPPTFVNIGDKTLWLPAGYWFEGRKESIATQRIMNNFYQSIDINYYFFSNHPRERVGYTEHEKFPFVYLPFLFIGFFEIIKNRKPFLLSAFFIPIIASSVMGISNDYGVFSIFPFFVIAISEGFIYMITTTWWKGFSGNTRFGAFVVLLIFAFTSFLYEIY